MIPVLLVLGLYLIGAALIVAGVVMLAGIGWGLIAAGICTAVAAYAVSRGMAT